MRLVFGFPIALITSFTSSRGSLCSCFANSKHIEEASWPYSGFDGFSKAKLAVEASGRVFFKAFVKTFSHSWRNSANGFADTIAFFALKCRGGFPSVRGLRLYFNVKTHTLSSADA